MTAQDVIFQGLDILLKKQTHLHAEFLKTNAPLTALISQFDMITQKNLSHFCSLIITLTIDDQSASKKKQSLSFYRFC